MILLFYGNKYKILFNMIIWILWLFLDRSALIEPIQSAEKSAAESDSLVLLTYSCFSFFSPRWYFFSKSSKCLTNPSSSFNRSSSLMMSKSRTGSTSPSTWVISLSSNVPEKCQNYYNHAAFYAFIITLMSKSRTGSTSPSTWVISLSSNVPEKCQNYYNHAVFYAFIITLYFMQCCNRFENEMLSLSKIIFAVKCEKKDHLFIHLKMHCDLPHMNENRP